MKRVWRGLWFGRLLEGYVAAAAAHETGRRMWPAHEPARPLEGYEPAAAAVLPTIEHAEIPNVGLKSFQHWPIYPYDHVVTADLITTASAKQRAAASDHRALAVPPPFSGGSGISVLAAVCKGCSRHSKDTMSRIVSCANPVWSLQAFAARRARLGRSLFAECARPANMGRGVLCALEILANTLHLDRAGDGATG